MKRLLMTMLVLIAGMGFLMGEETEKAAVNFEQGTLEQAFGKAAQENRLIFLDAFASWCGPCKYMNLKVFTDRSVAEYLNENFINMRLDVEKGEGVEIAKKYNVDSYPTILILDPQGKVLGRLEGSTPPDTFLKRVQAEMDRIRKKRR